MAHPEGEVATARACQHYNQTPFMLSSWATTNLETVAGNAPDCLKLFQIYLSKKMDVRKDIWKRVREAGYSAIGLTTDTQ